MVYRKIEANGQKLDYSIENISPRSNDGRKLITRADNFSTSTYIAIL